VGLVMVDLLLLLLALALALAPVVPVVPVEGVLVEGADWAMVPLLVELLVEGV
jgi:hypothetical protein